jgi:hypothetical protein
MAKITLLTDFGNRDGYAAAVKGVILRNAPGATLSLTPPPVWPKGTRPRTWAGRWSGS